jgi:hypothetical protein
MARATNDSIRRSFVTAASDIPELATVADVIDRNLSSEQHGAENQENQ